MKDSQFYIPKHLDEPPRWLFWTLDEASCLIAPPLMGLIIFDHLLMGFLLGFVLMLFIKKMKGREGHHFLLSLAYWYLPKVEKHFKALPPSYIREYLG
jgi:conjugal transfer pilus assembly protein TraL